MSVSDDKPGKSPVDRFRTILSAENEKEQKAETRRPPVVNLPKVGAVAEPASPEPVASAPDARSRGQYPGSPILPAFWTIACVVSLVLNAILLVIVLNLWQASRSLSSGASNSGLLAGMYTGFEQLDQAHIKAVLPIRTEAALNASIPVQTTTRITLAHDVAIEGARFRISTGPINIDAPASVTLPSGTSLDVAMDMNLPVQASLPLAMDVPIDVALQDTELHPAILGLQDALRPLLCASSPNARSLRGDLICR
jgi:hypothetical protein